MRSLTALPIPALALAALALSAAQLAAPPARAQGSGMNCFAMTGGRSGCMASANALVDRLSAGVEERHAAEALHERRLARQVAPAVHEGRCADALTLALKAKDPMVAANTARLCGVPDPDAAPPKG